jgi:hypothetical protein
VIPGRRQRRVGLRHRPSLGRQRRARRLQDQRRRQDLAKGSGRRNGSTGCAMLARSRRNRKRFTLAMWDFRRQGWTFRSGGPGSGLFKSTDGGAHWTDLTDGQCQGPARKTVRTDSLASGPESKPQVVYATSNSKQRALPLGRRWARAGPKLDASSSMVWRPFYFGNLIVDPKDENKMFKPDGSLLLSTDGGAASARCQALPMAISTTSGLIPKIPTS